MLVVAVPCFAGTWTPLAQPAPGQVNLMLLLPDGTVMAADQTSANGWFRLTPDAQGSYVNGTWTTLAPMHDTRLYYSSAVLQDGRVFVAGGEYGTGASRGEVYDPQTDTWTVLPPCGQTFEDAMAMMIPNGNVLIAPVAPSLGGLTVIFDPHANAWQEGPRLVRGMNDDEASWVKLPDESILTIDPFSTLTERYIPLLNRWINDTPVPVQLWNNIPEIGAGMLLPNGRAFYLGGSGHTALYTPSGSTNAGAWTAGPDIPLGLGPSDAPAAMMVNGKVLCVAGSISNYDAPTWFFEYDPVANSFTQVNGPTGPTDNIPPYAACMLDLPDGTVLYSDFDSQVYVYQPGDSPLAAGKPVINSVTQNADGTYHLTGTQLNGISTGAVYGDDQQMDSNYPLVRLTAGGSVYYARSFNWSCTGVMTSNKVVSTEFVLPDNLPAETFSLVAVANGIASDPVSFTPGGMRVVPYAGFMASGPADGPFDVTNRDFTITNSGGAPFNWALTNIPSWLAVSAAGGTVSAGGATVVSMGLAPATGSLMPGVYSASVLFSNLTEHTSLTRRFMLRIAYPDDFQPYRNTVLGLNPVGYWRLNETNQPPGQSQAANSGSLGNSADGQTPSPMYSQGALRGDSDPAALFVGGNPITVPFIPQFGLLSPFTVEAWVNPTLALTGSDVACPLSCGHFDTDASGWAIYQTADGWNFKLYNQDGLNASLDILAGGPPEPGVWYHLVAVCNGLVGILYVNGIATSISFSNFIADTDGPLTIGARSDYNLPFNGSIDEVAIYNTVLALGRVFSHYQNGTNAAPPTPYNQVATSDSPMAYYRMDSVSPATSKNEGSAGSSANGYFQSGSVPGNPGALQNGFMPTNFSCGFNGTMGFVDIAGGSINVTGPVTVMAWVKANPANGFFQTILSKGDASYRLDMDQNGHPGFADGQQPSGELFASTRIDDGQWHQLVGVLNSTHSEFLYVDGQLAVSTNTATVPIAGNSLDLWIGGAPEYSYYRNFSGTIDEAAVFATALSSNQVKQLYSAAFTVPPIIGNVSQSGGAISLSWSAISGRVYQVQYKTGFNQVNWSNAAGTVTATNSTATATDAIAANGQRIYRVSLLP